jgi:hypothetical protein
LLNQFANIAKREATAINAICLTREANSKYVHYSIENIQNGLPELAKLQEAVAMFDEKLDLDYSPV